jgi:SnoaL-like protein
MKKNNESARNAKETVRSLLEALNKEDFKRARTYVNDNFSFMGPLATRDSAEAYFNDMEKMRLKYDIMKVFEEDNDVCALYDFSAGPLKLFGCGWYHLDNDKISSIRVVYDPRPLAELLAKK